MSNHLTEEEMRLVAQARTALEEAKSHGASRPSEAFLNKCSSESGAVAESPGGGGGSDAGESRPVGIVTLLLRRLFSRTGARS